MYVISRMEIDACENKTYCKYESICKQFAADFTFLKKYRYKSCISVISNDEYATFYLCRSFFVIA